MRETDLAFRDFSCDLVDRLQWAKFDPRNHTKPHEHGQKKSGWLSSQPPLLFSE